MSEWLAVAPFLVALAAVGTWYVAIRKWKPDAIKAYADAAASLTKDNEAMRAALKIAREAEDRCIERAEGLADEVAAMRRINVANVARIAHLERGYAPALLARLMDEVDMHAMSAVVDKIPAGVTVSVSEGGGTFRLVNQFFADLLGYTKEEILLRGWRGFVHPDDLRKAEGAESTAWSDPLDGVVLRYIRKDGTVLWLRWFATPYINGRCLAVARDETPTKD